MRRAKGSQEVHFEVVTPAVEWRTLLPEPSLPAGVVHVWRADLDLEAARLHCLKRNLSTDEQARAVRFRFARDRERFVAARGLLREILALYLDAAAQRLRFRYGAQGKPFLSDAAHWDLCFNVSHSLNTMLVAVTREREVGVDIEHVRTDIAVEEIAEVVFSAAEKRVLSCLDGEAKRAAFYRLWVRKEAYIKADGRGISMPLEHIDVSVPAGQVATLDKATGEWRICTRWKLRTLADSSDYAAALTAEGQDWQLVRWQCSG